MSVSQKDDGRRKAKLSRFALLIFVAQIFLLFYVAFVLCYVPAVNLQMTSKTVLGFHFSMLMAIISHLRATNTVPRTVPEDMAWSDTTQPPAGHQFTSERHWCKHSQSWKPERSHFCRSSEKLVLKMDHYCPYVGQTIGLGNYKYFFLFLLWTSVSLSIFDVSVFGLLFGGFADVTKRVGSAAAIFLLETGFLSSVLSTLVWPFFMFHCYLTARGSTTIEFLTACGVDDEDEQAAKSFNTDTYVYDQGICRNISSNLGSNFFLWFLPFGATHAFDEDGLHYAQMRERLLQERNEEGWCTAIVSVHETSCEAFNRFCNMITIE